ncbi:MAG: DNA-binding transcriptional regulator Fis [Halomonas sp.]|uniref:DNA-binding transcriptional regulator Fis n=1 Tax=Halomonas TaxID=2745 RepID=UPI0004813C00|nr:MULTISPECIES: DNA-binding transcriptional regulator Fis [Halomonas]NWN81588.1 DNA-binding transcriptional regulator Fis [Halomonas sp.]
MTSQALPSDPALSKGRLLNEATTEQSSPEAGQQPLREAVDLSMRRYFAHLDGGEVTGLYAMVMAEVEAPLLASVLEHTQGNQTRAAEMLGLNRGTLRKKLKQHDLI